MKIDVYKDSIFIRFEEKGGQFKPISTFPHYKYWLKVLNYLRKRGFEVDVTPYHKEQNWGTSSHKVATKNSNGVCFGLECMNWQISLKFGSVKNLREFGDFWDLTDNRSKPLSYLESKAIENEVKQLLNFLGNYENHNIKRTAEESIIFKELENKHVHPGVDSIEKLCEYVNNREDNRNYTDADGKRIICGSVKYFYDYYKGERLCCGIAYHNINNMWWVVTSDGNRRNIASFELFDYDGQPRRKELTKEQKINRLESELKRHENSKNYLRCISINKQIEKLKAKEKTYHVWSLKWNKWWGANNSGYTDDKRYAGVYLESNILENQSYYNDGVSSKAFLI